MQELTPRDTGRDYYVYIMLSETPTKFGSVIRRFAKIRYNHASIAFDSRFRQLYSFGRRQNKNPLSAGLVKEHVERFTLRRKSCVNVRIYKLRVTREQYLAGKKRLLEIKHDADGYLYNLFSVLSFPVLHGFETYKAYSCAEFVATMLRDMKVTTGTLKPCGCTPEDLGESLEAAVIFEGNLLDYCDYKPENAGDFFTHVKYRHVAKTSCTVPARLIYRMIRYRSRVAVF